MSDSNPTESLEALVNESSRGNYVPVDVLLDNQCPRCGGLIPNLEFVGQYPGAISRTDNKTEICSKCGQEEALEQGFPRAMKLGYENITPQSEWALNRVL